jgi:hypothetical protein
MACVRIHPPDNDLRPICNLLSRVGLVWVPAAGFDGESEGFASRYPGRSVSSHEQSGGKEALVSR